jgi:hypothetical protein
MSSCLRNTAVVGPGYQSFVLDKLVGLRWTLAVRLDCDKKYHPSISAQTAVVKSESLPRKFKMDKSHICIDRYGVWICNQKEKSNQSEAHKKVCYRPHRGLYLECEKEDRGW